MKAVCSRHEQAYEVALGCPWCEPADREPGVCSGVAPRAPAVDAPCTPLSSLARPQARFDSAVPSQGFDSRKLTVDDMTRLSRFYAL